MEKYYLIERNRIIKKDQRSRKITAGFIVID